MFFMCIICDGGTHDDVMFAIDSVVSRNGWALQAVSGGRDSPNWAYTIGLADRFGHPELLIVACDAAAATGIIHDLVARIEHGERLDEVESAETTTGRRALRRVHQAQLAAGATALWHDYYGDLGRYDLPQAVLQIVADDLCCSRHRRSRWDLSRPTPLLNRPGGGPAAPITPEGAAARRKANKRQRNDRRRQQQRRRR